MNVNFYVFNGIIKSIYKLNNLNRMLNTTCYLKDGSSIKNPVILVKGNNLHIYNYCYIPDFNRYYFVEVESVTNDLWTMRLKVDVLQSNYDLILGNYAYIERTENISYNDILDDALSFRAVKSVTISNLSDTTQGNLKNLDIEGRGYIRFDSRYYISMSVVNDKQKQELTSQGGYHFTAIPPISNMNNVSIPDHDGLTYYSYIYALNDAIVNGSLRSIYQEAKNSFIKSVIVWPFSLDVKQVNSNIYLETIRLGNEDVSGSSGALPIDDDFNFLTFFDYTFPNVSSFEDVEPYTIYELFIPYVGWRSINISDVKGCRILITTRLNFATGKCPIYLINYTKNYVIASYEAQIGTPLSISRSNLEELNAQKLSNAIGMSLGILGGAVSTGLGAVSGNPVAITGGIMGITSSVVNGVKNEIGMFEKGQVSLTDSNSGLDNRKVLLKVTKNLSVAPVYTQMGKPANRIELLDDCNGFTKCGTINKLTGLTCSKEESDEIIQLLKEGIIINYHLPEPDENLRQIKKEVE